jgi:hypothetical protein
MTKPRATNLARSGVAAAALLVTIRRGGRRGVAALATVLALACGEDEPAGPSGSIQVSVDPAALTVEQGGTSSVIVRLTRGGGFNGPVTLAVAGLPAGVTTTITPAQLSGATASATIDVAVAATVAPGAHTATVTATAQGVGQATVTYQLTVAPDFALTVTPTALTIVPGASSSTTVNIARSGFSGEVALALRNPPAGITGAFTPTPSTASISSLAVSVPASAAPGEYPLTIQGTATGRGAKTTTLTVTVPAPPAGGNVEYRFCSEADVPAFFAYQDGDGGWQAVTGSSSGGTTSFVANLTQGRGGVLMVFGSSAEVAIRASSAGGATTPRLGGLRRGSLRDRLRARHGAAPARALVARLSPAADLYETLVLYGSAVELAQDATESCAPTEPTKTVTGTVAGVPAGAYGFVSLGGVSHIFDGAASTNPITFAEVPAGPVDLFAARVRPGNAPDRLLVVRNLNLPDGGALPSVIDFNGSAASGPATATATITGGAGDDLEIYVDVVTANGQAGLWSDLAPSVVATRPWAGLSAAATAPGEFHGLYAFASPPGHPGDHRFVLKYVGPVGNQTLALGPPIDAPGTTQVAAGAYPRFRFQGMLPAAYDKGMSLDLLSPDGSGNILSIIATGTYLASAGNGLGYDFSMPDVAGLVGFPAAARLTAGTNDLFATGFGFSGTGIFYLRPSLGGEFRAAIGIATISVP